eukprot:1162066-Pelagomonas_calceolata.AAC.3
MVALISLPALAFLQASALSRHSLVAPLWCCSPILLRYTCCSSGSLKEEDLHDDRIFVMLGQAFDHALYVAEQGHKNDSCNSPKPAFLPFTAMLVEG